MKANYEERAKKFIAQVYPYIKNCRDNFDFELAIHQFNKLNHRKVQVAYGSTRIALITSDYVIKVDYDGWGTGIFGSCKSEVRMYRQAKRDGFDYLLAKITPYRQKYNRTFYIMPRIKGVGRTPWDADFYLTNTEEDWVEEHIGDLHNENYGWKNGHIVIIDYAHNDLK